MEKERGKCEEGAKSKKSKGAGSKGENCMIRKASKTGQIMGYRYTQGGAGGIGRSGRGECQGCSFTLSGSMHIIIISLSV